MRIFNTLFTRRYYRSTIFWFLVIISLYTVGGFWIAPKIIKSNIIKQVENNLGWHTQIEKVELNPYLFTLRISNLVITDRKNQRVLSFHSFFNDFELRSIFEGAFTFSSVELNKPFFNIIIDKNGQTNIQQALLLQQSKKQKKEVATEKNELPKLLFDNISVIGGAITITNQTLTKEIKHQLQPINFDLKNFSTLLKHDGDYQLNIALGEKQQLQWQGNIGLSPLHSKGKIKISGIKVHKLWDYIEQQAPYNLLKTIATFEGSYQFSLEKEETLFEMTESIISLNEIKLAYKNSPDSFVNINKIIIGPLDFNLNKRSVEIKKVQINSLDLQLERNEEGLLTLLAPFTKKNSDNNTDNNINNNVEEQKTEQWHWQIAQFKLQESKLRFTDKQPKTTAKINISNINFQLNNLSDDFTQTLPFEIEYSLDKSGNSKIEGEMIPTPLNLDAIITLEELALPIIQPYLSEFAKIDLKKGSLSVNGKLNLKQNSQQELIGGFTGALNIKQFDTKDQQLKQRLIGWQDLTIKPMTINFNPLTVDIEHIALSKPYIRLIVTEQRSTNLAQLSVTNKNKKEEKIESAPLPIKIGKITLKEGNAYFADLSLTPEFATSIEHLNGTISGLSSDNLARADVKINGSIEEYGKMFVHGKINPLAGDLYTDITANFDKIELTTLTPYSGRYTGYVIDKGKLSLQLNYKIANRKLDGSNRLILDQFELGETVNSEESLDLPLKLALALFKDSDGIIDISLPTKGDLDDPNFKISGLVMQALLNVISKAITSPFSMLANLIDGKPEDLNSITFELGSSQLNQEQINHLQTLSKLLIERPLLILEIRVFIDKEKEIIVLKKLSLDKQLQEQDIAVNDVDDVNIEALQNFYLTEVKNGDLTNLQLQATVKNKEETEEILDEKIYTQLLYQALLETQVIRSLDLTTLAKQRISIIKAQLIQKNKVANEQVFAMQPSLDGIAEEGKIKTQFTLTTH